MPPGMQQQLRQGGFGGIQEMMKAMMGGEGGPEMEEMQRRTYFILSVLLSHDLVGMMAQMGGGLGGLGGGGMGGMPNLGDMFRMMGGAGRGAPGRR